MKKIISVTLALILALSMCTMAFATEDVTEPEIEITDEMLADLEALSEETGVSLGDIIDIFEQIMAGVSLEDLKRVLGETVDTITGIFGGGLDIGSIASQIPKYVDGFFEILQGAGVDTEGLFAKLAESELFQLLWKWYIPAEVPTTVVPTEEPTEEPSEEPEPEPTEPENPDTGITIGVTAFAAMSIAAAAAFVSKKKED